MPPGNDALAKLYALIAQRCEIPAIAQDLGLSRAIMEEFTVLASEPTEVTYEDVSPAGTCPGLWHIPTSAKNSKNVILYFHGGGFVTLGLSTHRKMVGHLAKRANCKALAIDYRPAPEARYPSQLQDAVQAYNYLLAQGYQPSNIIAAGDSAGGNLATSLVLKLRDLSLPLPAALIAFSPWYDMEFSPTTGTLITNASTDAFVRVQKMQLMRSCYLPENAPESLFRCPFVNPLCADKNGLPPIYLSVGGTEVLLDHSTRFADMVKKAGGNVVLDVKEGMQHVFPIMAGKNDCADQTLESIGKWAQEQFAK